MACVKAILCSMGWGPPPRKIQPRLAPLPATSTSSAQARAALLTNKKAQRTDGVTGCYVASVPRGSHSADAGRRGRARMPSECVITSIWAVLALFG